MKKAGAITAIIAGIFGVLAAVFTLFFGGLAGAFEAEGADTVIGLGWGGIVFSFLTIILGAIALGVEKKLIGVLIATCSIAGAILGGTIVAVCMVLSLIGGALILFAPKNQNAREA